MGQQRRRGGAEAITGRALARQRRRKATWAEEDLGGEGKHGAPTSRAEPAPAGPRAAGWWAEVQCPRCRGHQLGGPVDTVCCGQVRKPGRRQPCPAGSRSTRGIFLAVSVLYLYHR